MAQADAPRAQAKETTDWLLESSTFGQVPRYCSLEANCHLVIILVKKHCGVCDRSDSRLKTNGIPVFTTTAFYIPC